MSYTRAAEMIESHTREGGVLDFGPERSRLVLRVQRTLAEGRPVSTEQGDQFVADLGLDPAEADQFLRQVTERDADDDITGICALSLNATPHRLSVNGIRLWAWCAADTLFLPALLEQTATVESTSPVSGETVRLTVSPQRVERVDPPDAVVSIVIADANAANVSSVDAIWGTYCHHIFFFASRGEAEQWAAGRDDIAILSVQEGFDVSRRIAARILGYTEGSSVAQSTH
ncbi:MAG: organomercurial lyase [Dehalococcoidia bacterium]